MNVLLTEQDVEVLLTSLKYGKRAIAEAMDTPYPVRTENLERLEQVERKLQDARRIA
jgi:hypothetical protein